MKILTYGEHIRSLRKSKDISIKSMAAKLKIDPSLLGKIERNERQPNSKIVANIAKIFEQDANVLYKEYISDKIVQDIIEEEEFLDILKVAENKVRYYKKESNLQIFNELQLELDLGYTNNVVYSDVTRIDSYNALDYTPKVYKVNDSKNDGYSTNVKALSFFSGCGGLDIGCHLAGVEVISSMDFDPDCIKSLSKNALFKRTQIKLTDINNSAGGDYSKVITDSKPDKLIMIGGPPCQPFSKAGYWVGNNSRQGINDPRNMIGEYFRMIAEVQPDGFILENVESILHPTNRIAVEYIIKKIEELNFNFTLIKANAIDYGVPQKRKRVFFIASKNKFKTLTPLKTHGSDSERIVNPSLLPYERVIDWIGKYDVPEYFEKEELTQNGTYHLDLLDVPPGKNYISLTAHAGYPSPKFVAHKRFWSFLLKLHPLHPSWTIAAQPGPWVGPFHWKSRRLRVPEIAAIQTFPEDYLFFGSRRSIQKQIGNAVPPILGKVMVNFLVSNL